MDAAWRDRLLTAAEGAVVAAAIATIPVTVAEERGGSSALTTGADWAIWAVFVVEYALSVWLTARRRLEVTRRWLDATIIVVSFPPLPGLLALARLVRLVRLTRVLRVTRFGAVLWRGVHALQSALGQRGLIYVAATTGLLIVGGGGLISVLEPAIDGFGTGLWWAFVTATTVGYGDIAPTTVEGRLVAVVLMVAGIGLVATLAASVAAHFIGQDTELVDRLERIEAALERLGASEPTVTPVRKVDDAP